MPLNAVVIIGAGSWGTALAVQIARAGHTVTLWGRNPSQVQHMASARSNGQYLPGVDFPHSLRLDDDLGRVVAGHRDLLLCVPSQAFRSLIERIRPHVTPATRLAWATKGFEQETGKLPHEVARDVMGPGLPLAVLSGPTFAREVGAGLPTAMTIAATEPRFAHELATTLSDRNFRAYTSADMVGVEVGGAIKNVLAIGAGISDGLGFGANTRIAMITRGLVEMTRLGVALGAQPETFMGLSGMGDLVLTCTDNQSRNRRLGLALAAGASLDAVLKDIGQVVEGVYAAKAVRAVGRRLGIEMPICEQVYRILHEGASAHEAVMALMARSLKPESPSGH